MPANSGPLIGWNKEGENKMQSDEIIRKTFCSKSFANKSDNDEVGQSEHWLPCPKGTLALTAILTLYESPTQNKEIITVKNKEDNVVQTQSIPLWRHLLSAIALKSVLNVTLQRPPGTDPLAVGCIPHIKKWAHYGICWSILLMNFWKRQEVGSVEVAGSDWACTSEENTETSPPWLQVLQNVPPHPEPQSNANWLWTETWHTGWAQINSSSSVSFCHAVQRSNTVGKVRPS